MPPSQISAYASFYAPGITKVYIVTTMSSYLTPTRAELNAGLDVTRQVRSIDGWQVEAEQIDRPDYSSRFVSKIGGRTNAADSSLGIYAAQNGSDARSTITDGYTGYVVFLDGGDTEAYKMDVFPVLCTARPKQRSDSDPLTIMYQFSITSVPAENVAIPAA
jgi:hypothetical protein